MTKLPRMISQVSLVYARRCSYLTAPHLPEKSSESTTRTHATHRSSPNRPLNTASFPLFPPSAEFQPSGRSKAGLIQPDDDDDDNDDDDDDDDDDDVRYSNVPGGKDGDYDGDRFTIGVLAWIFNMPSPADHEVGHIGSSLDGVTFASGTATALL
ncbi:hypothetical protein PoB_004874600 [Plakobranchus ocellatus]|uniref:Uncharacterized protein n=1 Tax=Plakobranchus ocellatus TaxID=259542 RepID=A0AAV4BFX2_9GAST|nr:hypothetical protein PoB_004874600 [Plakobranchus ocellatus]